MLNVINMFYIYKHVLFIAYDDIYIYNHPEVDRISGISKKNGPKKTYR